MLSAATGGGAPTVGDAADSMASACKVAELTHSGAATRRRTARGATVAKCAASVSINEKHRKYNSGDCLLGQDVKLTPLVFTPGGRIGPAAEDHFRDAGNRWGVKSTGCGGRP